MDTFREEKDRKKHNRKQNLISAAILIFGTASAYVLFGPKPALEPQPENPPVSVQVAAVSRFGNSAVMVEKTATLRSTDTADVVTEFSGRIRQVSFDTGDYVKRGQVLAFFDQSGLENAPKVNLNSAQASFELARKNVEKTEDVFDEAVEIADGRLKITREELEQAKKNGDKSGVEIAERNVKIAGDQKDQAEKQADLQKNSAKIQLEQARLQLDQARIAHQNTIIKAPISGKIVFRDLSENAYIGSGTKVAQIVGHDNLEAVVYLNRDEIRRVSEGAEVKISIEGETVSGKVASLSEIANEDNNRFEVRIISEQKSKKSANSNAKVSIPLSLRADNGSGFFVPLKSVILGQRRNVVFVVEGGLAKMKEVETGMAIGDNIEIVSGINEGDLLIVEGNRNVRDGQAISISE